MSGALPNQFRSLSPCGHHRFRDVTGEKEPMAGQRSPHSPPRAPTVGIHLEAGHTERRRETRRGGGEEERRSTAARARHQLRRGQDQRAPWLGHFLAPPPKLGLWARLLLSRHFVSSRRSTALPGGPACCERASILQSLAKILGAGPCQEPPGLPFLVI